MEPNIKRVMAIHDLSGFGRSSLTSIIPTLSTMGIQVCPLPTAILSTHLGGFKNNTFHDLTEIMTDYAAHWKELNLKFDCIYSGFLGSTKQIDIVSKIVDDFRNEKTLVVIDPVMGDDGSLYSSMPYEMVDEMKKLIKKADIIMPNYTEASLLLNKNMNNNIKEEEIKSWLKGLCEMGPKISIITSAPSGEFKDTMNTVAYDSISNRFWKVTTKKLASSYPGTGDIFASVMTGSLLKGDSLPIAMDRAVQFISQCMKASQSYDYLNRDGVMLEKELHFLNGNSLICEYEEF